MEFFLDVDGVILDFESSIIDFIRKEYIKDLPKDFTLKTWELVDEFESLDIEEVWKKFINSPAFSRLNLLVNAERFNDVSAIHPVYLITNIPNAQFDSRQKNLNLHNLSYKELHLAGHYNFGDIDYPTKSAAIKKLHTPSERLIFLDDHPKNCQEIIEKLPQSEVFLMSRPHNMDADDTHAWTRVNDWDDFMEKVN